MNDWSLAVIAAALIAFAAVSARLRHSPLTSAIVFTGIGLAVGIEGFGWVDPGSSSAPVRALAEATLTLVLFADASRIDLQVLRREYSVPLRLLGIGLPLTIAAGAIVAGSLFASLTVAEALVLAVML